VRPATHADLNGIDQLYVASEEALGMLPESRTSFLRWKWSQPYLDLERDTRVLVHDGGIVGFSMTDHDGLSGPLVSMGRTHHRHLGRGLGGWLVDRAIRQARLRGIGGVRTLAPSVDRAARELLLRTGFAQVRTTLDMGADLTGQEQPGEAPLGVRIRRFERGADDRATWELENAAFRDHWDHIGEVPFELWESDWFSGGEEPAEVLLAEADDRLVGEVAWVGVEGGAYVLSVATLSDYRRRGIAGALLRRAIADIAAAGHPSVYLSVDSASPTGAVGVYERAGLEVLRTSDVFDRDVA